VGVRADYKNFNRLIKAYALYHQKFPDVKLVCTSHPFSSQEYSLFEQYGVNDVVLNISANETLMNQLYQNALFFIYPSLYEGFGMPILEAWMNNCPVVLSDASCFPEICGDAGLYFNPNETEEMLASMIIMTEDDGLRKLLIEKGDMRVKEFSWERCAKEHEAVYKSLL
jgi:glycosyltransferase involved in cell wall biosynthesis